MRVLALDLSTKSSGWATKANGELEYGCVTAASADPKKRIMKIRDEILAIVEKYDIDTIIYEEVRPVPNSNTTRVLTWLQAVVIFGALDINKNMRLEEMQPSEWRSKIGIKTGRGITRATLKQKDIEYAEARYGIRVANDDEADAICLLDAFSKEKESAF